MPKFIIHSSETVYYQTEVEAESEDEARDKFWEMNHDETTLVATEADHWQIDYVAYD